MKVKLTQKYIDNPPPVPAGKAKVEHCDSALPGLLFEQRLANSEWGSYRLRYKSNGRTAYITLGKSCEISLVLAREQAKNMKAQIQLGADPQAEARARKAVLTWDQYMETIYIPHVKAHLRSWKNLVSLNDKYLSPAIGHLALDRISLQAAQTLHRDMVEVHQLSPASADHLAKLLRQTLRYAVRLELIASSPVSKIRLLNVDNREERLMSKKELSRLISALNKEENKTFSLVVKFLLFTGARVSEALNARWTDIDRDQKTWKILAMNSKSKTRRAIALSDSAIAVLDQLKTEGKSEWLFTSTRGGGRLTTISKRWGKFRSRKDVDLPSTRLHDLRHMHASMLINSGHSLYVVQQALGHSDPKVTARYSHLSTATLQAAANSVGAYVENAVETDGK